MNDNRDDRSPADRLDGLKAELAKRSGRLTQWKALCVGRDVTTMDGQIRLAEEVLAAPSTGTNAEWLTHHLRLQGGKSFDVDEMLVAGSASRKDEAGTGRWRQV